MRKNSLLPNTFDCQIDAGGYKENGDSRCIRIACNGCVWVPRRPSARHAAPQLVSMYYRDMYSIVMYVHCHIILLCQAHRGRVP